VEKPSPAAAAKHPAVAHAKTIARRAHAKKGGKASKSKAKAAPKADASSWDLAFKEGTYELTPEAEKQLSAAAAALPSHQAENLRVTGHSDEKETEGAALAGQRAKLVAGILVNRYQVDSKRIVMTSAASGAGPKVELGFARAE
jgi:outer membrane protein OmpA-like peptidoglycan-associated protein